MSEERSILFRGTFACRSGPSPLGVGACARRMPDGGVFRKAKVPGIPAVVCSLDSPEAELPDRIPQKVPKLVTVWLGFPDGSFIKCPSFWLPGRQPKNQTCLRHDADSRYFAVGLHRQSLSARRPFCAGREAHPVPVSLFLLFSLYARNRTHSTSNSMGWAYPFFSSFFSFFYFEEDPTNRLLSTSSAYSYRTLFLPKIIPKSSGTLSALPFLVKEREFDKLMQLRKKVSLKAGTKTVTTILTSFKGLIDL
ncbi:hypothetical protein QYF36_016172 [Acer negundo]|nr:hypothetical protein QYF36_016172 [Acer negundo]